MVLFSGLHAVPAQVQPDTGNEPKIQEAMPDKPVVQPKKDRRILVYSKASGFRHGSIGTGISMIRIMAEKTGAFSVDFTETAADFTPDNLARYDAVFFNNTTKVQKDFKSQEQRDALLNYIRNGGGYFGVHAASDAGFPEWTEYTEMVGGVFDGHPWGGGGTWGIRIEDKDHPITKPWGGEHFKLKDELYKYRGEDKNRNYGGYDRSTMRVLMSIDVSVSPHRGERKDRDHALVWVKNYGKGRVFFSALGHNKPVFWEAKILQSWLTGIQWALGDLDVPTETLPQPPVPEKK
ncbi:MAG: ThuA domain-containing protein [Verrucomicrobiota bacterium]